jgi:hypothetical protein
VALPEKIPVKRTEEEAEFVSVRPVVRESFRIEQLVDMLLALTGKNVSRLQQILRSGTAVYHFYRYWWEGFEAAAEDLQALLAKFPDADPTRAFGAEVCTAVVIEDAEPQRGPKKAGTDVERKAASRKRLLRGRSLWNGLMDAATEAAPAYVSYSYARRADIYALELSPQMRERLAIEIERHAPRGLRGQLRHIFRTAGSLRIVYLCPREN